MNATDSPRPKVFAFVNGGKGTDWVEGLALAEDGTCLAGHVSSSEEWSRHDMDVFKRDLYAAHYPSGYEFVWVEEAKGHPGVLAAYEKNQALKAASEGTAS